MALQTGELEMTAPTAFDDAMTAELLEVIRTKFDLDNVSDIQVTSVEIDQDEQKIRIELMITTTQRPEALAKGYFGLTGKVREALGSDWSGFFPVITPQFSNNLHA